MPDDPYAAIKIPDFRRLLSGRLLFTLSTQIQGLAVGWQIYELTKNPLALGLIGLAEIIPAIGVALYAGHLADKIDRRRIAMTVVFVFFLCMCALGWCSAVVSDQAVLLPMIYGVVAVSGLARGFYGPSVFG